MNKFLKYFLRLATFFLPPIVLAQATNTNLENPLGTIGTPTEIFARVAGGLSFITGSLALLFVVIGGYMILTAAGSNERYSTGKNMIVYAIIGLLVTVGSYTILTTTINVLTGAAVGAGSLKAFKTASTLIDPLGLEAALASNTAGFVFYGKRIISLMVNLLGVAAVVMYVIGGLQWMLSGGSEEKIATAKRTLTYATIGTIIVLSSYILIRFVYAPFAALLVGG
jgi:hypothetical protein